MADSNIKVEIVGENSKFTQAINDSIKAMQSFADKAQDSIQSVSKSLNNLENDLKKVTGGFNDLATAVVGAGLVSFISNAMESASATERLADATGVTTAKYMELQAAFISSGKDAESLGRTMLRMEATAQQANDGNERLKNGYAQLGISMEYLQTHSPDETFLKVAQSLAGLDNAGKRAELTMMLLGRDAKTIDWDDFVAKAEKAVGSMDQYSDSNEKAAKAMRSISEGIMLLKNNVLLLLEPLMKLIGDDATGLLGSKVVAEALVIALGGLAVMATIAGLAKALEIAMGALNLVMRGVAATIAILEAELAPVIAGIALLIASVAGLYLVWEKLTGKIPDMATGFKQLGQDLAGVVSGAYDKLTKLVGLDTKEVEKNTAATKENNKTKQEGGNGKGSKSTVSGNGYNPAIARAAQLDIELDAMNRANDAQRRRIALETELAGAGTAYRAQRLAAFDEDVKYENERAKLIGKRKVLELTNKDPNRGHDNDLEIANLTKEVALLDKQHGAIGGLVAAREQAKNLAQMEQGYTDMQLKSQTEIASMEAEIGNLSMGHDAKRLDAIEKEIQKNIKLQEIKRQQQLGPNELVSEQEKASVEEKVRATFAAQVEEVNKMNKALHEQEAILFAIELHNKASEEGIKLQHEMSQLVMTTDQKRIDDLKKQNELMIEQEIIKRRQALGYDDKGNLKELDPAEIAKVRQQVTDANADILTKNQEIIDKSREFSTGWTAAFNQYKSDAENAAMAAKSMFSTMTTSFEDLMVNFVKTGSLDFKTFANNIIAEFVRIQAKQIALGIFGGGSGSGAGGLLGSILGLPGKASGGPVSGNSPYIVGENGPELFVPRSSGQIVPNGSMGGSTQVTYNIQATDAASFRTMLAREPELLYAITQKGANSVPSSRY